MTDRKRISKFGNGNLSYFRFMKEWRKTMKAKKVVAVFMTAAMTMGMVSRLRKQQQHRYSKCRQQ